MIESVNHSFHAWFILLGIAVMPAAAATYEVGPGSALRSIGEAPWGSLKPGDQVLIHWRPEPYREKWVIAVSGQADSPIVVRGIAGPDGKLPVIDGRDAISGQSYTGEDRAAIKIGDGATPSEMLPSHIVLENLDICGATPSATFQSAGRVIPYRSYAAAVWIQKGEDIIIRHCILRDSANGLLTSHESARILVEKCRIHDNGMEKSTQEHNIYTESSGIIFQFNKVGPLRPGALGNTLKDRSSDTVIRYNWLEGGSRILDLVDSDYESVRASPSYKATSVYGNVMIKDDTGANNQIVHYGGDSGQEDHYRHGVLNFYHNTVIAYRQPAIVLFRLSSADDSVLAANNIFCAASVGSRFSALAGPGRVTLDHNLFTPGWKTGSSKAEEEGVKTNQNIENADPAFADFDQRDFRPSAALVSAGLKLTSENRRDREVRFEYREPCSFTERAATQPPDIGAFARLGESAMGRNK